MTDLNMHSIAREINLRAKTHSIGTLPEIRKDLKQLNRLPKDIFTPQTTFDTYAYHHGGRTEIQFNIGWEDISGIDELRHGIAFSLETSQTLPTIHILIPKIKLFNEFIHLYSEEYADMRMWHYQKEQRSTDYMPGPIPPELLRNRVFIFLGKRQPLEDLNYEVLLTDLDRLLPLYNYVESDGSLQPILTHKVDRFAFRPGCTIKPSSALANQVQRQLDINLRHNVLQEALKHRLEKQYGADNVGGDIPSGTGTFVDLVVRREEGYWFYEIKTAHSPRACIREALAQLLEYAFWPGAQEAVRLIIVGETVMDKDAAAYLSRLREQFSLPIEYEQIKPNNSSALAQGQTPS